MLIILLSKIEAEVTSQTFALPRADDIPSIPMTAKNLIQSNVISSASHFDALDDFPDDDFLTDIDVDQITSNATNTQVTTDQASTARQNQNNDIPPNRRSTLLFDELDDEDFLNIDSTIEQMNISPRNANILSPQVPARSETIDQVARNTSIEPSIWQEQYRFKIRGINLVTIKQLKECSRLNREQRKHFIVRAVIDDVIQQARISQHKWKLGVLLTDPLSKNLTLEATFSSKVLDKLAGRSGREVHELHAVRTERPQVEDEIANIMQNLTDQLEVLDIYMKLEFNSSIEHPVVIELINLAPVLDQKLQQKIDYEKLM